MRWLELQAHAAIYLFWRGFSEKHWWKVCRRCLKRLMDDWLGSWVHEWRTTIGRGMTDLLSVVACSAISRGWWSIEQQWKLLPFPLTVCCCGALTIDCATFHLYMRRVIMLFYLELGPMKILMVGTRLRQRRRLFCDCSFIRNLRCMCNWNSYSLSVKHSSGGVVVGIVTRRWNVCKNKSRGVLVVAV